MKKLVYITLMICSLFILQSCSSDLDFITAEEDPVVYPSQTITDSTGAAISIDGTYLIACTNSGKSSLVISATNATMTGEGFTADDCATGSEHYTYTSVFSFTIGAAGTDNESTAVNKVSLTLQSQILTPKSDIFVTSFNESTAYGFTDWAKDIGKNIMALNEDGTTNTTNSKLFYDIWSVSGTSLRMGAYDADIDTTTTYPTALDSDVWVKQ